MNYHTRGIDVVHIETLDHSKRRVFYRQCCSTCYRWIHWAEIRPTAEPVRRNLRFHCCITPSCLYARTAALQSKSRASIPYYSHERCEQDYEDELRRRDEKY